MTRQLDGHPRTRMTTEHSIGPEIDLQWPRRRQARPKRSRAELSQLDPEFWTLTERMCADLVGHDRESPSSRARAPIGTDGDKRLRRATWLKSMRRTLENQVEGPRPSRWRPHREPPRSAVDADGSRSAPGSSTPRPVPRRAREHEVRQGLHWAVGLRGLDPWPRTSRS